jgi:hypothetical protein
MDGRSCSDANKDTQIDAGRNFLELRTKLLGLEVSRRENFWNYEQGHLNWRSAAQNFGIANETTQIDGIFTRTVIQTNLWKLPRRRKTRDKCQTKIEQNKTGKHFRAEKFVV